MWNFLGGVGGGLLNLVGGLFGQSNQRSINQQNIAASQLAAQNSIQWRVQDAIKAGINPLAALGSNFQASAPSIVGSDAMPQAFHGMGQNLSRAAQAYADSVSKSAQLDNEYKQAQIDLTHSETAKNLVASRAVTAHQPGSPPGLPLPVADPRYETDVKPSMQRWYGNEGMFATPSREFTGATFSIDPVGILHALSSEAGNISQPNFLRPDVLRSVTMTPYDPALFGGGM